MKSAQGKAPSISPIRGSARLPLSNFSDKLDRSDGADESDWTDRQLF